ncbi:MAG: right-handed parallel beta-helix repeat-containing protein, partial [Verrucomicrobia bacterium]|nr:right-handed parallel beta-helix repeat-containing protein [Verrucomicrobiota bacterium]
MSADMAPTCLTNFLFRYSSGDGFGGALYCEDANVLLASCFFRSNTAYYAGGAVSGKGAFLILRNCVFEDNGNEEVWGSTCFFEEASSIEMFDCAVTGAQGEKGVTFHESDFLVQNGLFSNNFCCALNGEGSTGQIRDSRFFDNQSAYYSGGAYFWGSDVSLSGCVFFRNSGDDGGALYCRNETALEAQNCLFSENASDDGAVCFNGGTASLQNCTLFSNQCAGVYGINLAKMTLRNTILWSNLSGSYNVETGLDITSSCLPEEFGANNIQVDPMMDS